jgi:copper chaperone CopZ
LTDTETTMRHAMKTLLAATLLVTLAPVALAHGPGKTAEPKAAEAIIPTLSVRVDGMTCVMCAQTMESAFSKEPGVTGVHVDVEAGQVHIALALGAELTEDRIRAVVTAEGYEFVSLQPATT